MSNDGNPSLRDEIVALLERLSIPFERLTHAPVHSCEDSRRERDAAGWSGLGSKNIVFHARGHFFLVVTSAERELKARLFKREFGTKNIRFASVDEVREVTGCEVGSVPPFGISNSHLPIYVDSEVLEAEAFLFNPGVPNESIRLSGRRLWDVYAAVSNPVKVFSPSSQGQGLEFEPVEASRPEERSEA